MVTSKGGVVINVDVLRDRRVVRVVIGSLIVNVVSLVLLAFPGGNDIPGAGIALAVLLAVVALVGAYGLLRGERWGWWMTLVATVVNVVTVAPGTTDWSSAFGVGLVISAVIGVVVIVSLFRRDVRHLGRDSGPLVTEATRRR